MSKSSAAHETKAGKTVPKPTAKVAVTLRGREYIVACDPGDEKKLAEIVKLVDAKINDIARASANATETRLFMLTCLLLADELIETRKAVKEARKADENLMVAAVEHLQQRIISISQQVGRA